MPPKQRFFCHASSSVSPARRSGILVGRCGRAMCCRATAKSLGDLPYEIKENEQSIRPPPEPILQLRIVPTVLRKSHSVIRAKPNPSAIRSFPYAGILPLNHAREIL